MSVVVPDEGEKTILNLLCAGGDLRLGLFKNNVTVGDSTVIGDLTPADYNGYLPAVLGYPSSPSTDLSGRGTFLANQATFAPIDNLSTNDIYGWYIYSNSLNKLVKCGNFAAPITLHLTTDFIKLTDGMLCQGTIS